MLGLTRRLGQANAGHGSYDFSLETPGRLISSVLSSVFSGPVAALPEILICEQHPRDARNRMADCCPLFPFRRQVCRPPAARGGDRDPALSGLDRRAAEQVEQPLL